MTEIIKNKLIYQLEFLKSIGYDYHSEINYYHKNIVQNSLPNDLISLEKRVKSCYLCDLSKTRKNVLFAKGNTNADLFFIGEEPSAFEDETNCFYSGKSGEMFLKIIENVLGLNQEQIYFTYLVKCKPNTNLNFSHFDCCSKYLLKQIELVNPKLIVLLGEKAYRYFFKDDIGFSQQRGELLKYGTTDLVVTYSPSFLLRNPSLKKDAYFDILKIKNIMEKWN